MTQVSAPAGSGKTVLLHSWIRQKELSDRAAWVSVQPDEHDAQRFWLAVLDALRGTAAGSGLVRELTPTPDLDTGQIVERLLKDLGPLAAQIWLVVDDVHELRSTEALRQLELLLMRAPPQLRFVLVTRHDLRLGMHRVRLEGGLTEIREAELLFTRDQAKELFEATGVPVSDSALTLLHERTEGWAAGLRLAALSLAGHPDPERFAAEFSGSERTVAEYLLAEVLERQPEEVRRLLLRTSVLERVSGPLADRVSGGCQGERILQELEQANAFVVSLDAGRSWFRYHRMFVDLLKLELRRTEPSQLPALHRAAAEWLAEHRYPVEAIRHAQAAEDWDQAAVLLADNFMTLLLDGRQGTLRALLADFPAGVTAMDADLLAMTAAIELWQGALEEAQRHAKLAQGQSTSLPAERQERFHLRFAALEVGIARRRGDLPAVVEAAQPLLTPTAWPDVGPIADDELRALALLDLGVAEFWTGDAAGAERHLEQAVVIARRIDRPYLEIAASAQWALVGNLRSSALAEERSLKAIGLAERHGWSEDPALALVYVVLALTKVWRGHLEETERWLTRAEHSLRAATDPTTAMLVHLVYGLLALARGRQAEAFDELQAAERLTEMLVLPFGARTRAFLLHALALTGERERAEQTLAAMDEGQREAGEVRTALAALRLAEEDPEAATAALAPVVDGSTAVVNERVWLALAFLLEAIARDALGDAGESERALELALDVAEPEGVLWPFLLHPAPALLEGHARHRTTHASLVAEIQALLSGRQPSSALAAAKPLQEPLTESETRVLRYLPTNLSLRAIGNELSVSVHTIKTHVQHIYEKLGTHGRAEAVERARALGLLAPSSRR